MIFVPFSYFFLLKLLYWKRTLKTNTRWFLIFTYWASSGDHLVTISYIDRLYALSLSEAPLDWRPDRSTSVTWEQHYTLLDPYCLSYPSILTVWPTPHIWMLPCICEVTQAMTSSQLPFPQHSNPKSLPLAFHSFQSRVLPRTWSDTTGIQQL